MQMQDVPDNFLKKFESGQEVQLFEVPAEQV